MVNSILKTGNETNYTAAGSVSISLFVKQAMQWNKTIPLDT